MLSKKQLIVSIVLAVIIGVWLTAVSPMMTVNYVKSPQQLTELRYGFPFSFLEQDCSAMDGTELIPQYPVSLKLSDPIKYPLKIYPIRLAMSGSINVTAPFILLILLELLFNWRIRIREKNEEKQKE
ncbi:MAG: hypothetical protein HFE85_01995 [Clostridiales bacterium]|nr:hypothetical protein [Clostridiales bacterium]